MNPIFRGRGFKVQDDLCFVLMPFANDLRAIFDNHIKKVVRKFSLECKRADDIFDNKLVMEDIWQSINEAQIIIADLTGRNPNVFYEVGIAHTVGKDVILIAQSAEDVPFDLRPLRYIKYEYTPPGMKIFEKQLRETITKVLKR